MTGAVPLETVYAKRLDLVRPDRVALAWRCADEVISGAAETVATLRQHGKAVYMVTSGLLQAVAKFAGALGIAPAQVYAVEALLMGFGAYQGFDSSLPALLQRRQGNVCRSIAAMPGMSRWLEMARLIWPPAPAEPTLSVMGALLI